MENINKDDQYYNCKMETINKIIELYPNLQSDKLNIITTVFNCYQKQNKYIFTKIKYNNEDLYQDPEGMLFDSNMNFKGCIFDKKYYMNNIDIIDTNIDIPQLDLLMKS